MVWSVDIEQGNLTVKLVAGEELWLSPGAVVEGLAGLDGHPCMEEESLHRA